MAMEAWEELIVCDERILAGKPVIKGTRLSVEYIVDRLANGWTIEDLTSGHPGLSLEGIRAALACASPTNH